MKSASQIYFDQWLTLMEQAYEALDIEEWRELEEKILAEIAHNRKRRRREQGGPQHG